MRRLVVAATGAALVAIASGCGGSGSPDAEQMTAYVDAQAHALCVVQANAYASQAKQEAAYRKALQSSNQSEDELAEAEEAARTDVAVRKQISDQVAAHCG
jgi:hypothetical protein